MKQQRVESLEDLDLLEEKVLAAVEATVGLIKTELAGRRPLEAFARLKFSEVGRDPLNLERPLNLVEQLNQTFTYLASIEGARWLLSYYPECGPLVLNLGTAPGFDIESECGKYVAETFAVTHPGSNDKLRKDATKLQATRATFKFVFYLSPTAETRLTVPGVKIVRLDHAAIRALNSDA